MNRIAALITVGVIAGLLAVGSMLLFGCGRAPRVEAQRTEQRVVYVDDAQEVMIGMLMSGRYKSVSGTNDNGRWTITATLR